MVGLAPRAKDCCEDRKLKQLKAGMNRGESQRNSPSTPANSLRQSPLLASVCLVVFYQSIPSAGDRNVPPVESERLHGLLGMNGSACRLSVPPCCLRQSAFPTSSFVVIGLESNPFNLPNLVFER